MNAQLVHTSVFIPALSTYDQNILRVLLYFDIFQFPLKAEEIYSFLPSNSTTPVQVAYALESPGLRGVVNSSKGYFFLKSTAESCIEERQRKERRARRRMKIALRVARFIGLFPFVRGVMLSGELAKGIASKGSDIDFVIVSKRRRLWLSRSVLIIFKKTLLLNSKKYFCLNHFITEDYLAAQLRNIYSATEIATLKPLHNRPLYVRYMRANDWIKAFFPNWHIGENIEGFERGSRNIVQQFLEWLVPERLGDRIDNWLLGQWKAIWKRRYPGLSQEELNHKFRCEPDISTAYGEDFQRKVLNQYSHRLLQFGLPSSELLNEIARFSN